MGSVPSPPASAAPTMASASSLLMGWRTGSTRRSRGGKGSCRGLVGPADCRTVERGSGERLSRSDRPTLGEATRTATCGLRRPQSPGGRGGHHSLRLLRGSLGQWGPPEDPSRRSPLGRHTERPQEPSCLVSSSSPLPLIPLGPQHMEPAIYQMLRAPVDFWEKRVPDRRSCKGEGPEESASGLSRNSDGAGAQEQGAEGD